MTSNVIPFPVHRTQAAIDAAIKRVETLKRLREFKRAESLAHIADVLKDIRWPGVDEMPK